MRRNFYLRSASQTFEKPYVSRAVFPRLIIGGFTATLVMTLWVYLTPFLGLPNVDFAGILGYYLAGHPTPLLSGGWWAGMIWHFFNGTVLFPFIYAYWIYPVFNWDNSSTSVEDGFSQRPVLRGEAWGMMLFGFCQMVAMPLAGGGIFSAKTLQPLLVIFGSLVANFIYGAVFGVTTATRRQPDLVELPRERAA